MQRNVLIGGMVAVCVGLAVAVWRFGSSADAPPPVVDEQSANVTEVAAETAGETERQPQTTDASSRRAEIASIAEGVEDDPEIRAAMCGFKGRIVDHRMTPQAGCGVRMYRGAVDSVMKEGFGKLAEMVPMEPDYVAGEAKTNDDGTFLLHGVWPRGFYLMLAGIGTDAPTHQILTRTPAPGEVVDLGDIVLNDAAVAVGKVVDENGKPVAGAVVMAADLPGAGLDFVPVDRFDPKGCVLIREQSSPVRVIDMPAWVATAFEHLPIPMTRSGADGSFRLPGIAPGMNLVAAVQNGLVPALEKAVKFEKGQTRDIGELTLREGEEVTVKVVDAAGKPIEGAEVVAGSTSTMVPVDFASRLGATDKDGRITALGFGRGKVTAAARRSPRDAWILAEPQPTLRDVVVTLPSASSLQVRVTMQGQPVAEPKLQLLTGKKPNEAALMAMFGVQKPLDLNGRTKKLDDGRIEIENVPLGHYTLLVKTEGAATGLAEVEVTAGATQAVVDLKPSRVFAVRVLGPEDAPVRNAAIYARDHASRNGPDMIQNVGRTDKEGRLSFDDLDAEEVRVTAEHPKWGMTHARGKLQDGEITLRFRAPGWIDGTLLKGGKPLPIGKYAVVATERSDVAWNERPEAVEGVPTFATPGLDGTFAMRALQPGKYSVSTMPALDALRSPGGFRDMMEGMFDFGGSGNSDHEMVEVVSGQGAKCALELDGEVYQGPVGQIFGTVQIDGLAAEGAILQSWGPNGRKSVKTDANGRFELRDVPVGHVQLNMRPSGAGGDETLWSSSIEVTAGQSQDLLIDVRTAEFRGIVLKPDGTPATGLHISAQGEPLQPSPKGRHDQMWRNEQTDSEGRFAFERVPEGVYSLQAQNWGNPEAQFRGELKDVRVESGRPRTDLVLRLRAALQVKGRVDLSALAQKPEWAWISLRKADPAAPSDRTKAGGESQHGIGVDKEGAFETTDLDEGAYWATLHFHAGEQWAEYEVVEQIQVGASGSTGLNLSIRPKPPAQPPRDNSAGR